MLLLSTQKTIVVKKLTTTSKYGTIRRKCCLNDLFGEVTMGTTDISTTTVTTTVMLVISILFAIILAISALVGFFRRWKRSTVGLCRIIIAVVLAAVIVFAIGISTNFSQNISDFVNAEVQSGNDELSETAILLLVSALYSIAMPFVFVVVFVIIAQILRIPAYFISKSLHITKHDEIENQDTTKEATESTGKKLLEQFGGALISVCAALIVICVCILPVTGLFCTVADGITEFSAEAAQSEAPIQIENESGKEIVIDGQTVLYKDGTVDAVALNTAMNTAVAPIRNNFFVSVSYSAPMKLIYRNITKVKMQDVTLSFGEEMNSFFKLASNSVCFVTDFENYGEKQMAAADELANYVINSEFRRKIAADFLSAIAKSVDKEKDNELLVEIAATLEKTTEDSVVEDVKTVRDIFKSAIRNNIPKAVAKASTENDGYIYVLESINEDFIYDFLSAIQKNSDFSGLISPALNYAFRMITKSFGAEQSDVQAGTDLKELSDEQLKSEAANMSSALASIRLVIVSLDDLNSESDDVDLLTETDLAPLGAFVDRCRESLLLGNGAKKALVVILRSDEFSKNGLDEIFDVIANHIERDETVSLERTLVAVQELVTVMNDYQNGNESTEELSASIKKIVENLDAETAAEINEILPKINARMINGGDNVSEGVTQTIITSFVESLSSDEAKELAKDEEAFEKEVQAIDIILDMINAATAGVQYSTEDIKAAVETVARSKITTKALVSAAYDENGNLNEEIKLFNNSLTEEDKLAVMEACKEYYNEEKSSLDESEKETIKSNLTAIASIFGEDISAQIANWN